MLALTPEEAPFVIGLLYLKTNSPSPLSKILDPQAALKCWVLSQNVLVLASSYSIASKLVNDYHLYFDIFNCYRSMLWEHLR